MDTMAGRVGRLVAMAAVVTLGACGPGTVGSAPPASSAGGAVIPSDFALLGPWVTEITKGDLEGAGLTDPGLQNENSGRFTWTFAPDGTWTQVQETLDGAPINSPVFRGTYTVDGTGFVATTTFPTEYADSGLHYTFTMDGDEVRFDLVDPPDPILPVIVETHPWRRPG